MFNMILHILLCTYNKHRKYNCGPTQQALQQKHYKRLFRKYILVHKLVNSSGALKAWLPEVPQNFSFLTFNVDSTWHSLAKEGPLTEERHPLLLAQFLV